MLCYRILRKHVNHDDEYGAMLCEDHGCRCGIGVAEFSKCFVLLSFALMLDFERW